MLAPILVFTADEIWENLAGRSESEPSVHIAEFPKPSERDRGQLLERWERLFEVRDQVLRVLEEARIAKHIGSSLEAKVTLSASGATLDLLRQYESELRYLFIVSQVEVVQGSGDLTTNVSQAEGEKCERCWNYSTRVGESESYPTVCERCMAALEEIEREAG
jgi:isoleucyl-tRNA synthetase